MATILLELMARMPYKYEVSHQTAISMQLLITLPLIPMVLQTLPRALQDARPMSLLDELFRPLGDVMDHVSQAGAYSPPAVPAALQPIAESGSESETHGMALLPATLEYTEEAAEDLVEDTGYLANTS
jgi:hypothetical protein